MNNTPGQVLKQLITTYGISLCDNPARCKGLLKDHCGDYQLEINVLITALEEHITDALLNTSNGIPYDFLSKQLVKRLKDTRGLGEEYAQWAVNSWAEALGIYKPSLHLNQTPSSENTTKPGTSNIQSLSSSYLQQGELIAYPVTSPTPSTFTQQPKKPTVVQPTAAPLNWSTNTKASFSSTPSNNGQSFSTGNKVLVVVSLFVLIGVIVAVLAVAGNNKNSGSNNTSSSDSSSASSLYPPAGATLALDDPLSSNINGWSTGSNNNGGDSEFTGDVLQVSEANAGTFMDSMLNSSSFSNFAFEVQMTITQGDAGGLIFRAGSSNGSSYALFVSENGGYTLDMYGASIQTLTSGTSSAISQGLNQTNTIAVMAQGSTITIFANQQQVDQVQDSTYSTGSIGLLASAYGDNNAPNVVSYSNLKVWTF